MKTAIVTGGTKGIGKAIADMLLREGYFVHVTYASDDEGAKLADNEFQTISDQVQIHKVDQADKAAMKEFSASITGPVNCIVCNAGTTLRKALPDVTDEDWERVMQVGVNSHFYLIRDLWKQIQPESRIIFIGSMMAVQPHGTSLAYGTMKGAVHAMAKNLVKEFEGTDTTINVIAPGFVDTEWQKNKPREIRDNICKKTAIHRFCSPEEVADAARFIVNNGFVNGAVIEVSGGYCYK